jgi:hypothetical protein
MNFKKQKQNQNNVVRLKELFLVSSFFKVLPFDVRIAE